MTRALFLDRDGTLIVDTGYPRDPALVAPIAGVFDALRALQTSYALVIVSNQSGLARGRITPDEARVVHERVVDLFAAQSIRFAGAYYCPHGPDEGCRCRKPAPGMLLDAARDLDLELTSSVLVGDKLSDIEAAHTAGCGHAILFHPDGGVDWKAVATQLAGH